MGAKEIREARKKAGMTQLQISDKLGIPLRTIKDWESGTHNPPKYVEDLVIEKLNSLRENP